MKKKQPEILVLMCGPAASGKTDIAKFAREQFGNGAHVYSTNEKKNFRWLKNIIAADEAWTNEVNS